MASITPRISGLFADGYFDNMGNEDSESQTLDDRTPLDRTIDRIGMGTYQWALVALCGFGWLSDNMWIQSVAIILPRVQQHYDVSDSRIGYLSSSMFAGMMIGAVGWGSCSDILGRSTAFNLTLFFTAIFGLVASFAPSFSVLCIVMFLLGSSVGGSMPTDGTLLLEHMPRGKKYLVTALSVCFSVGSVVAAVVGMFTIPGHSCPRPTPTSLPCDVSNENEGWRYLLLVVGLITLSFFLARIVFFRLHESPRYLVHAGRPQEALVNLQKISRFNGSELSLDLHDVIDHHPVTSDRPDPTNGSDNLPNTLTSKPDVRTIFDVNGDSIHIESEHAPLKPDARGSANSSRHSSRSSDRHQYEAMGSTDSPRNEYSFTTPNAEDIPAAVPDAEESTGLLDSELKDTVPYETASRPSTIRSSESRRSSFHEAQAKICWSLPRWLRRPLWAWTDRMNLVLAPEWRRTTILLWATWCAMALAYTMFNVFLPKMLEMSAKVLSSENSNQRSLEATMWDVVIFTIGGLPGSIIGAYMIESSLGRQWTLALSTFTTAAFCIFFVFAESSLAVRTSSIGVSLTSTTMWAVLYGWTPEIFDTAIRGTACGTASALSRIGGMIAPVLGGILLATGRATPVYTSAAVFVVAGICVALLRVEDASRKPSPEDRAFAH